MSPACATVTALSLSLAWGAILPQDSQLVGSSLMTSRVPPPEDLKAAGDSSGDDKAYHRTQKSRGGNGYKHFDRFHKKDGDSFGYEKHSGFGDAGKGGDEGEYFETSSYDSRDKNEGSGRRRKPKITSYHYESKSGTPRDYSKYDPETYEGDYTVMSPVTTQPRPVRRDPQAAGTEEDAEYDYYYDEGDGEREGGYYSGEEDYGGSEEDYY